MTVLEKNAQADPKKFYPLLVRKEMKKKYSTEDEIALINNYISAPEKYGEKYAAYQAYRAECKGKALQITGGRKE